jgi:hypothetical protein
VSSIDVYVMPPRDNRGQIKHGAPSVDDFGKRAPDIAAGIREAAAMIQAGLEEGESSAVPGAWAMDAINLSFEMSLEASGGVLIATASASATFSVEIAWKRA